MCNILIPCAKQHSYELGPEQMTYNINFNTKARWTHTSMEDNAKLNLTLKILFINKINHTKINTTLRLNLYI